jgi:hypothetical protein
MIDNAEEEHLDNPTTNKSENPSHEIVPTDDTETINPNQKTVNMEIHAHDLHKAPGHGWKHYIFEFLMLFLAVFCGFLADNQREHMAEHKKEKEYLSSLVGDLKYDTSQFNLRVTQFEEKFPYFDSLFVFFNNPQKFNNELPYKYWKQTELISATYIPAEPTLQQLKYSGNFRLLSNHKVLDSILIYESHINGSYLSQTNYVLEFYKRQLESKEKYFDNTNFNRYLDDSYSGKINSLDNYSLTLLLTEKAPIKEIYNQYVVVKATNLYYINQLKGRRNEAERLLMLIQKEYGID